VDFKINVIDDDPLLEGLCQAFNGKEMAVCRFRLWICGA
jgi:hypothetical protein